MLRNTMKCPWMLCSQSSQSETEFCSDLLAGQQRSGQSQSMVFCSWDGDPIPGEDECCMITELNAMGIKDDE